MAQLPLSVKRMFALCELMIKTGEVPDRAAFYDRVGFGHNNLIQIVKGRQAFRVCHYQNAVDAFNLDANYFFRKRHTETAYTAKIKPLHVLLIELAARVEAEIKSAR